MKKYSILLGALLIQFVYSATPSPKAKPAKNLHQVLSSYLKYQQHVFDVHGYRARRGPASVNHGKEKASDKNTVAKDLPLTREEVANKLLDVQLDFYTDLDKVLARAIELMPKTKDEKGGETVTEEFMKVFLAEVKKSEESHEPTVMADTVIAALKAFGKDTDGQLQRVYANLKKSTKKLLDAAAMDADAAALDEMIAKAETEHQAKLSEAVLGKEVNGAQELKALYEDFLKAQSADFAKLPADKARRFAGLHTFMESEKATKSDADLLKEKFPKYFEVDPKFGDEIRLLGETQKEALQKAAGLDASHIRAVMLLSIMPELGKDIGDAIADGVGEALRKSFKGSSK